MAPAEWAPIQGARNQGLVEHHKGSLEAFDDVKFLSMPHVFHGIVSVVMSATFAAIAFLLTISASSQNVYDEKLFASPDSANKMRFFVCKTVVTLASAFLTSWRKLLSLILMVFFAIPLYDQLMWQPFYRDSTNNLNATCGGLLFWGAVLLVAKMYGHVGRAGPDGYAHVLTNVGLYSAPFAALFFLALSQARLSHFARKGRTFLNKVRFALSLDPSCKAEHIAEQMRGYKFRGPFEVEAMARVARSGGAGARRGPPDPHRLMAAEAVLLVGMAQFPDEPVLQILYGSFLVELHSELSHGTAFFERARHMQPNARARFMLFVRDREQKQRAQGDSMGGGAMDLVSYVEFQNAFTQLLKAHRGALRANRRFWRLLLRSEIAFRALADAFELMDKTELKADRAYRAILERYPKSVKLLRAYAGFLEEARARPLLQLVWLCGRGMSCASATARWPRANVLRINPKQRAHDSSVVESRSYHLDSRPGNGRPTY